MRTVLLLLLAVLLGCSATPAPAPRAHGVLPQSAYIWQRQWSDAVTDAVLQSSKPQTHAVGLWPLAAELSCERGRLRSQSVPVDYQALGEATTDIAVVIRIGPCPSATMLSPKVTQSLTEHVTQALARARRAGLEPREIQVDFDATVAQLDAYTRWIEALRPAVQPTPITITALPAWLGNAALAPLLAATDGWVLQVHGLAPPTDIDHPMAIFDVDAASTWIERAAELGQPFRVSLPTYGYVAAFDDVGTFVGLAAEQAPTTWPSGITVVASRSDPRAVAGLVRAVTLERPAELIGLAWFRLPVVGDRLAWSMPTWRAVTRGEVPPSVARAHVRAIAPGLAEIDVVNPGPIDHVLDRGVHVRWSAAPPVAADGLHGFAWRSANDEGHLVPDDPSAAIVPAGQRRTIGWIRMEGTDVDLDATLL